MAKTRKELTKLRFTDDLDVKPLTPEELKASSFTPNRDSPEYAQGWLACEQGGERDISKSVDWVWGWDECKEKKLERSRKLRKKSSSSN